MAPSRTSGTIESYRRRVEQIRRQVAARFGYESPSSVPPMDLVDHLLGRKEASEEFDRLKAQSGADPVRVRQLGDDAVSRATWRQYKASLLFVLAEERAATVDGVAVQELDLAIQTLQHARQSGALKRTDRTSGRKMKAFPDSDFQAIVDYLVSHVGRHRRANQLLTWLLAGRLVGVRPSEWKSAGLIEVDGVPAVRFGNAKATNGRANGPSRTLLLKDAAAEDVQAIDDMLYMLVEQETDPDYDFDDDLRLLGDYMRYVTRRVLGKRPRYPTLYSLRHQLAADAKNTLTQPQVAAVLGHGSDATAGRHYGRKVVGQRPLKVTPVATEVATVRHAPTTTRPKPEA